MDTDSLVELVPHYVAMLLLAYLALAVVRVTAGNLGFWGDIVVIGVVVFAYRPAVTRLGIGPSSWDSR
jgi:hypothetical protein